MMTCGKFESANEFFDGGSSNTFTSCQFLDEQSMFFQDQWLNFRADLLAKHHTDILLILREYSSSRNCDCAAFCHAEGTLKHESSISKAT